ncbi:hypothetical protein K435DRAFT_573840, partial [Dendrothele bispora CBS 962.96]
PKWAQDMETYLLERPDNDSYKALVAELVDLESSYGFESSTKSLSTKGRPDAVHHWIARKRKEQLPGNGSIWKASDMQGGILDWWNSLMPDWRQLGRGSNELRNYGWVQEVKGSWGDLRHPGVNGLYSLIACMKWWLLLVFQEQEDSEEVPKEWQLMRTDIGWV